MREILKYGLTLMVLTGILSSILAFVYVVTEPRRLEIVEEEKHRAIAEVLPSANHFREEGWYFKGYETEDSDEPSGFAFPVRGEGYSSTIETMVGVSTGAGAGEPEISGIKIISQQETPGLGARIEEIPAARTLPDIILGRKSRAAEEHEPWFQKQFRGKTAGELETNGIDGVTGATITTEAVVESVRKGIEKLKKEEMNP
jgi:Na+-translocating ferredoxin:NAD+ oxidoreductase subunit G